MGLCFENCKHRIGALAVGVSAVLAAPHGYSADDNEQAVAAGPPASAASAAAKAAAVGITGAVAPKPAPSQPSATSDALHDAGDLISYRSPERMPMQMPLPVPNSAAVPLATSNPREAPPTISPVSQESPNAARPAAQGSTTGSPRVPAATRQEAAQTAAQTGDKAASKPGGGAKNAGPKATAAVNASDRSAAPHQVPSPLAIEVPKASAGPQEAAVPGPASNTVDAPTARKPAAVAAAAPVAIAAAKTACPPSAGVQDVSAFAASHLVALCLGSLLTLSGMWLAQRRNDLPQNLKPTPGRPALDWPVSARSAVNQSVEDGAAALRPEPFDTYPPTEQQFDLPDEAIDGLPTMAREWADTDQLPAAFDGLIHPCSRGIAGGGLLSVAGPVRTRNEDAGVTLTLPDGRTVIITADGMGGHPDGHLVSRLAVLAAAASFAGTADALDLPGGDRLLLKAVRLAFSALNDAVSDGEINPQAGSTLLIVIADSHHYRVAWLGDGGVYVRRPNGYLETLMVPHKGEAGNTLERYLCANAPASWAPGMCVAERHPGDLLALGSDGVMDRVQPEELMAWAARTVARQSVRTALRQLVTHFCGTVEHGVYMADDNMTLALLATPASQGAASAIGRPV